MMKYSAANNAMMVELNRQYAKVQEMETELLNSRSKDASWKAYDRATVVLEAYTDMAYEVAKAQGFRLRKRSGKGFDLVEIDPT